VIDNLLIVPAPFGPPMILDTGVHSNEDETQFRGQRKTLAHSGDYSVFLKINE
jgi:hypothetical protein